jgi:hypothetical protein
MILSRQQSLNYAPSVSNYDQIPPVQRTLSAEVSTYKKEKASDIFLDKLRLSTPPRTTMNTNINQSTGYISMPPTFKSVSPGTSLPSR